MAVVREGIPRRPRRAVRALKPIRLRDACNQCHTAKVKCSGEKTGCDRCTTQSLQCAYSESRAGKVPGKRARNHTGDGMTSDTLVDTQIRSADDVTPAQPSIDSYCSTVASRVAWPDSWTTELNSYDQTCTSNDSLQALMWSPMHSDFTGGVTLSESLDCGIHTMSFPHSIETITGAPSHNRLATSGSSQVGCDGAEEEHTPTGVCLSPSDDASLGVGRRGGATSSSSSLPPSELVSSAVRDSVPDIPALPTPVNCRSISVPAIASPIAADGSQLVLETRIGVVPDVIAPIDTGEVLFIDELQFVRVVCQLVESLQNSITTQVRVLDILLSMVQKTVSALGTLTQTQSGKRVKVSPHCLALLYSCMFQVVQLAKLGRDCLREEMAAEVSSSGPHSDAILDSLDFVSFSSDTSDKRVWRARRAVGKLSSTTQEVRRILTSVSSTPTNIDGCDDDKPEACLQGIIANLERLTQEYREASCP